MVQERIQDDDGLSLSELLALQYVARSILYERLGNQLARDSAAEIRRLLRQDVLPYLIERAEHFPRRGIRTVSTSARFRNAMDEVDRRVRDAMRQILRDTQASAIKAAQMELDAIVEGIRTAERRFAPQAPAPIADAVKRPKPGDLSRAVREDPFAFQSRGMATLKQWYERQTAKVQQQLRSVVAQAVATGDPIPEIVKAIRGTRATGFRDGVEHVTRRDAEVIARTAVSHATNAAREELARVNPDLFLGVQWIATLDARTCPTCGELDGQVFQPGEGPRPPAHPLCRCTATPVTVRLEDLPPNLQGTRASLDGQVPASLTFEQWLENAPPATVKAVLGATRAEAFRQGKLTLRDLLGPDLSPLNIEQLSAKLPSVF